MLKIAIDAMGGDLAPEAPVRAAATCAERHPEVEFVLCGDEAKLATVHVNIPGNLTIRHAAETIEAGDEPVRAVRRKQDSSLVVSARMVRDGEADAMISAGNTGALVAAGLLVIGRMSGIERPALAPVMPTFKGNGVLLLDAGATMDATSENLVQFAHMGTVYSRHVLGVDNPRVGLLNVGTEDSKGNGLTKQTFPLLQDSGLNFVGNIEAREVLGGSCDVVVADGFVGNVVLKLTEGVGLGMLGTLKAAMMGSTTAKMGALLLKRSMKASFRRFDYAEYGGAPFLGVAGGCFKVHGSGNDRAWFIALEQGVRFLENGLLQKITTALPNS